MRALGVIGGVATAAMTLLGSLGAAPAAHAKTFGIELNGTWKVISNGEWARTNEVLIDQKTTIENWTISSSCVSPIECNGTVTSDGGWTAPIDFVKRLLDRQPRYTELGTVSRRHLRPRAPEVLPVGDQPRRQRTGH